jgi:hypothetical protein
MLVVSGRPSPTALTGATGDRKKNSIRQTSPVISRRRPTKRRAERSLPSFLCEEIAILDGSSSREPKLQRRRNPRPKNEHRPEEWKWRGRRKEQRGKSSGSRAHATQTGGGGSGRSLPAVINKESTQRQVRGESKQGTGTGVQPAKHGCERRVPFRETEPVSAAAAASRGEVQQAHAYL